MGTSKCDYFVEENGTCFICLKRAETSPHLHNFVKQEYTVPSNFPTYSLKALSRFLGMDVNKLFKTQGNISNHPLSKVIQSELKVQLCDKCSTLIEKFSLLNQKLKKIRMEVLSSVRNIHERFMEPEEEGRVEERDKMNLSRKHSLSASDDELRLDKLEILKILRTQAIEKCSIMTRTSTPRVKMEKLTMEGVRLKKLELSKKSKGDSITPQPTLNKPCSEVKAHGSRIENVKNEYPQGYSECDDTYDSSNCSENFGMRGNDDYISFSEGSEVEPSATEIKVDVSQLEEPDRHIQPIVTHRPNEKTASLAGKQTKKSSAFRGATRIVTVNDKYQCGQCKKLYKSRVGAWHHYNSIHLKFRYTCTICAKVFVQKKSYKVHYQAVHLGGGVGLTCNKCKMTFTSRSSLKRHQLMKSCASSLCHKAHKCRFCDKGYSRVKHLNAHVKTAHLKSSRHECHQCMKMFTKLSNLKAHVDTVHKRLREHRCNICTKTYSAKSSLKFHQLTAHGP